jgi:hypothetical protein
MPQMLSPEDFESQFGGGFRAEPAPAGLGTRFGAAIDRSQAGLLGVGEAVGLPLEDLRRENQFQSEQSMQRYFRDNPYEPQSYKDVEGVGSALRYARGLAIDSSPELLTSLASGGAGALMGLSGAARVGLAAASNYPTAVGDILQNQREEAGQTNVGAAGLLGIPYAAADLVGLDAALAGGRMARTGIRRLDEMQGIRGGLARTGANVAFNAPIEGGSETFQELVNQAGRMAVNPRQTMFNPEANDRYLESFVGGAALGGAASGAMGGWRRSEQYQAPEQIPDQETDLIQKAPQQYGLVTKPAPLQQRIDQNLGIGARTTPTDYAKQFEEAYNEPSGQYVTDPATGLEKQLSVGEYNQMQGASLDLTQPAPAGAAAAATTTAKVERDPRSYELRDTFGVIPTPSSLQLYTEIQASGVPVDSDLLIGVWKFAGDKPMTPKRLERAHQLLDEAIINARKEAPVGTTIPAVSQPAGSVGVGGPVVPGVVGNAGSAPIVQSGVGGGAPVAGAPLPQTNILPSTSGQQSSTVVTQAAPVAGAPLPQTNILSSTTDQSTAPLVTQTVSKPSTVLKTANAAQAAQTQQAETQGSQDSATTESDVADEAAAERTKAGLASVFGERNGNILYDAMVAKLPQGDIATKYGVGRTTITDIAGNGKTASAFREQKLNAAGALGASLKETLGDVFTTSQQKTQEALGQATVLDESKLDQDLKSAGLSVIASEGGAQGNWQDNVSKGAKIKTRRAAAKIYELRDALSVAEENEPDSEYVQELRDQINTLESAYVSEEDKTAGKTQEAYALLEKHDALQERIQIARDAGYDTIATKNGKMSLEDAEGEAGALQFRAEQLLKNLATAMEIAKGKTPETKNAVQVESPTSVSVQPKAQAGQGVGKQVRSTEKPAGTREAKPQAPTKILTEAEQASQAWDVVAAEYPTAPKFADLTEDQRQDFIDFGPDNWGKEDVQLELTKLARTAAAKTVSSKRPTGNESVLINAREITADDDIALEDESRVGAIMISTIDKVRDGKPGRASAALKEMTEWADANNKRLVLMPSGNIAGSKDNLVAWYERNGFVQDSDGAMVREPASAQRGRSAAELVAKEENVDQTVNRVLRMSRQTAPLFSTDLYLGKENVAGQSQYGRELRNPVTLSNGTRLDGFTSPDQSVFSGYDRNGQRITIAQASVKPEDVMSSRDSNRTANAVKAALGTQRLRLTRGDTVDVVAGSVKFEGAVTDEDSLRRFPGVDAALRHYEKNNLRHVLDAVELWMVAPDSVDFDAAVMIVDGKQALAVRSGVLANPETIEWAMHHELGHIADEANRSGGIYSSAPELNLGIRNGKVMPVGRVIREIADFIKANPSSGFAKTMAYPLDHAKYSSLTADETRMEVFAQLWAMFNTQEGNIFLEENLPGTFDFMEINNEAAKQDQGGAGTEAGATAAQAVAAIQTNRGTQGVPRAIFRIARPTQATVDNTIGKLPKQAQKPVRDSVNSLNDWVRGGIDRIVFTSDLINRAVAAGLKTAAQFQSLLAKRSTKTRELERDVERIADMYSSIEEKDKGSGPTSANQFIFDSTRTGKWGYGKYATEEMAARFDALGPKTQAFVKAVFAHGSKMLSAKKQAVMDYTASEYDARIAAETDLVAKSALMRDKVNDLKKFSRLFQIREGIPYAPIKRFGDHVVVAKSKEYIAAVAAKDTKLIKQLEQDPDHYHVSFTETKNEARNLAAQLDDQGHFDGGTVAFKERSVAENELFGNSDSLGAITRLRSMANAKAQAGEKGAKAIQTMISDLYLQALAEGSARKSEMRRRGVAGELDMLRSFAAQGRADANFVASVEFNPQVQDALQAMRKEANAGSGDLNRKSELLNEITRRYESSLETTTSPTISKITRLSSIYYLATSPAYYLQNLTQPWMMSVPAMAGRHDYAKTSGALMQAYGQLGGVMKSARLFDQQFDFDKVPADVRAAIQELVNRGKIDIGMETELGEFKIEGDSAFSKGWNKVDKGMRLAVQKVESLNRLSTAMAAYRLELSKTGSKEDAINYADQILTDTHGDYSAFNAPRAFNTQLGKVALQFRKFQLIQLTYYAKLLSEAGFSTEEKRAATKALVYSLGHTALLAGVMGLPGYSAIAWAIGALFGDDDDPLDVTAELRKWIGDENMANLIMRGAPTLAGMDISGKVGAGTMLSIMPYSQADLTTRAGVIEAAGTLLGGAPVGMAARMADGLGLMLGGNWYKGMEQILPKGLGDVAKAYRISTEGLTRRNGDILLPPSEVSAAETVMQALGIQPVKQSVVSEKQRAVVDMNQNFQDRSTKVKADYIKAVRSGESTTEARAAWTKLQEARANNGYTRQPLSELLKAPQVQAKRERQTKNGVQFNKANKRFVEEQI